MRHDATVAQRAADEFRAQAEALGLTVVAARGEMRLHVWAEEEQEPDVQAIYSLISRRYPGVWIYLVVSRPMGEEVETTTYSPERCCCCGREM